MQVGSKNTKREGEDHKLEDIKCNCEVEKEEVKLDKQEFNYSKVNWLHNHHSSNYVAVPNLDLTLAVAPPKANQPSPAGPFLLGPIRVT